MEHIKDLMQLCRQAMQGKEHALGELNLETLNVNVPSTVHLDVNSLQLEFTAALTMATAAKKLGRTFLEKQCVETIKYIKTIAKSKTFEIK